MKRSWKSTAVTCLVVSLLSCDPHPQAGEGNQGIRWKRSRLEKADPRAPGGWEPAQTSGLDGLAAGLEPKARDRDRCLSPYFHVESKDPDTDRLPLKSTRAEVHIAGVIARVKVTQEYRNEGQNPLEAVYLFPASTRAAVHAMKMTIGERVIEARIRERQKARKDYENARRRGQTASLLEQQRPNVFQMNVANILPGDVIRVEMEYTELLVPEDGTYEFVYPTVVGPRYSGLRAAGAPKEEEWVASPHLKEDQDPTYAFDLAAQVRSGMPISKVTCPSHDVHVEFPSARTARVELRDRDAGNRDFVLRYRLSGERIETGLMLYPGQKENFFLLMLEPPERVPAREVLPREYIFVVDVSGSMHGFPLEISKALMQDLLSNLRPVDCFNLLLFAGGSSVLSPESRWATRENVDRALEMVDRQRGGGGTRILQALERALDLPRKPGTSRTVVVATDGYVRVEKESFELISTNLGEANLFAFGIGSSVNRHLIEGLAHAGMGEPFVALDREEAVRQAVRFRDYLSSPLMKDIRVEFEGFEAYGVEPPALPDLFKSRPVVLFGKYRGRPRGEILISGRVPGEKLRGRMPVEEGELSAENSALRTLWARHRIRRLSDLNHFGRAEEPRQEITRLGLEYNLMTAYTSFVAVDSMARTRGEKTKTVKQPLPMPRGVSNRAVGQGGMLSALGSAGGQGTIKLGALGTSGRGGGGVAAGYGGLGLKYPGVRSASPKVMGSLDRSVIQRVIRRHRKQLKACHQKFLAANPDLHGKIVVKMVIDVQGKVKTAEIVSSTLKSKKMHRCLLKLIRRWRFPKPPGGGQVVISYPFIFAPAK